MKGKKYTEERYMKKCMKNIHWKHMKKKNIWSLKNIKKYMNEKYIKFKNMKKNMKENIHEGKNTERKNSWKIILGEKNR